MGQQEQWVWELCKHANQTDNLTYELFNYTKTSKRMLRKTYNCDNLEEKHQIEHYDIMRYTV